MEQDNNSRKYIKTTREFLTEQKEEVDNTYVKTISFNGKKLTLHKIADDQLKTQFYLNTMNGESYLDINKILPNNMLIDAIWVEIGGKEEKIADMLEFLEKTTKTTNSGFNKYIMYNIID